VVEEFCPQVEILMPGACALSARGPARYFGGEDELARKITEALGRRGFACRVGIADGLFAARLAAQARPSGLVVAAGQTAAFLASHPVSVLGSPELTDLLPRLGIWTLGRTECSRTGWRVARTRGRLCSGRHRRISLFSLSSTRRPSRPNPSYSPLRRSPGACTPA
jgi:nucleotidyltransferase/DNA polymerase involved in DNA repair